MITLFRRRSPHPEVSALQGRLRPNGGERQEVVGRPTVVEAILAKGDIGGPLALEDLLALMVVALIYVTLALVIVTSERRKKRPESARGRDVSLHTPSEWFLADGSPCCAAVVRM